ncbi:MAG: hypothetical protein A3E61_01465 [Candidatus Colwellbacteria bacterium RIFCSPHIGHO2_12_FULL_43_12]|uniref:Rod shape-determining protein RodA n=1 Tax=Candidatus Colwellbacteria bacterium RIFCSPHIGHO2_12_FULL_43_12 TaxID=1797688 RepID=A0A1G1Z3G1_9BACT|nr:MAG: hypothetical protein A3E61_01465 [Candidatus Colwellbacteria bacterium RIFCSPHIGHO2_12_FULL_43_12]
MKLTDKLDFWLLGPVLYLMFAGLLIIYSVDVNLFFKQLIWVLLGIAVIFSFHYFNLRAILSYRWMILAFYILMVLMLAVTYFVARPIAGTKGWISLGPAQIQPSEFMKAALIILFSRFFATRHVSIASWRIIIGSVIYIILPVALVLLQPDLGTALIILGIWFGYLLVSELPLRKTMGFIGLFLITLGLAWNFGLASYQKERVLALFDPTRDPLGINYSVIQSKIAIGSAGFWGKGFEQGTQIQLGFLPASTTDFVFASFTEEWGLLGALTIIAAFLMLLFRISFIGERQTDNFYKFICLGTLIVILLHLTVNLGSTLGLLPVVGVGLPFVSYGGSNLLTLSLLIGIIHHIAGKRAGF